MRSLLRFLVWTLLIVGGFIGLARATAIRWWQVPTEDPWLGASVTPSVGPGDWLLLWRLTRPAEGDLVICAEPGAPERIVVGRILGSGNDELEIVGGAVTVNRKGLRRERGCDGFKVVHPKTAQVLEQSCSVEDMDGTLYQRGNAIEGLPAQPALKSVRVQPGQFFLVSDNRQFSFDSRDFGPVDASTCHETIVFRLWGPGGYFDPNRRFELVR